MEGEGEHEDMDFTGGSSDFLRFFRA